MPRNKRLWLVWPPGGTSGRDSPRRGLANLEMTLVGSAAHFPSLPIVVCCFFACPPQMLQNPTGFGMAESGIAGMGTVGMLYAYGACASLWLLTTSHACFALAFVVLLFAFGVVGWGFNGSAPGYHVPVGGVGLVWGGSGPYAMACPL
eukprot:363506-Chlamydomonas_euryale.AAC.4